MGTRKVFPGVGKLGGLETKVRQRGPGLEPGWGSGGETDKNCKK